MSPRLAPMLRHAKAIADQLIKQLRVTDPPIPLDRAAMFVGATVQDDAPEECSCRIEANSTVISVPHSAGLQHKRFIAAHGIGHLLLHRHDVEQRCNARLDGSDNEFIANAFAKDLLMPLWMLERDALLLADRRNIVDFMAKLYGVTPGMMVVRLTEL